MLSPQRPRSVVMIRPHGFRSNPETMADNRFQAQVDGDDVAARAHAEVTRMAQVLGEAGVRVHIFEDEGRETPDSVFPNNWFSTHAGGHIAIYPMRNANRRLERRDDVIAMLKRDYRVQDVIDYSGLEEDGIFLEGTGAMVLDHIDRIAYVAQSDRVHPLALERFCTHFNFEPIAFEAADAEGHPIYHTNVMMCIGTEIALVVLSAILDPERGRTVAERLAESGREVIDLSQAQLGEFCGNALELTGRDGPLLALSARAMAALTPDQRARIETRLRLLSLDVPTLELAGGSVRCMLAGIHLSPRHR